MESCAFMQTPIEEDIFQIKMESILEAPFIPTRDKKVREWRIGEILLEDRVITHSQLQDALQKQHQLIVHDNKKRHHRSKGHLLIVDNDEEYLEIFFQIVKEKANALPFTVSYLSDSRKVLEYLLGKGKFENRQTYPECDLVLLDIHMPEMDGFQVLKMMQETKSGYRRPLVAMHSSLANPIEEHASLALGARCYLSKSGDWDMLLDKINLLMNEAVSTA